jgi:hypothetical protein
LLNLKGVFDSEPPWYAKEDSVLYRVKNERVFGCLKLKDELQAYAFERRKGVSSAEYFAYVTQASGSICGAKKKKEGIPQ